jgi:hypothetical protein
MSMSASLTELPPALAAAVRRARSGLSPRRSWGRPVPTITDPALRAWIADVSRSGELDEAIRGVADGDADLAG